MKKLIFGLGVFALFLSPLFSSQVAAACYEPYYPAKYCDTQGFDNCVNYICPPPPTCGPDDDCNSDPEVG